jgi:hypothetical protein
VAAFVLQQRPAPFVNVAVQGSRGHQVARQTCSLALGRVGSQLVLEAPRSFRVALKPFDDRAIGDLLEISYPMSFAIDHGQRHVDELFSSAASGCEMQRCDPVRKLLTKLSRSVPKVT